MLKIGHGFIGQTTGHYPRWGRARHSVRAVVCLQPRCEPAGDRFSFDSCCGWIHFLRMNYTESRWLPVVMLTCSNVFMTCAWYGHLKFKEKPLWAVILVSWGIAFFEYLLQVPANRWGNSVYSAPQLKIMQEVITLVVFTIFAMVTLHLKIRWNHVAAFLCILAAVAFAVLPKDETGSGLMGQTKPGVENGK